MLSIGILAALTAIPIAHIQRLALHNSMPLWPWIAKTALAIGILLPISIFLARFSLESLNQQSGFMLFIGLLIVFGLTSFGTALIQGLEIQSVVEYPRDWVWISSLTWVGLSFVGGSILLILDKLLFGNTA
ncbi:hypothetical protein ACP8Y2_14135 [Herpetosiphon llansteffanensis]